MDRKNLLFSVIKRNKVIPLAVLSTPLFASIASAAPIENPSSMKQSIISIFWRNILSLFPNSPPQIPSQEQLNPLMTMQADIFHFIANVVTWTPEFFFSNPYIHEMVTNFGIVSVGLVTTLAIIEGLKSMLGMSHTDYSKILLRLPVALLTTSFAPYLFTRGAHYLNKLTNIIIDLGYGQMVKAAQTDTLAKMAFAPFNGLALTLFVIGFAITAFPILLRHGKRWFNLIVCLIMTPFAMGAYLFDNLKMYHQSWLNTIKDHALSQLAYSFYISILALLMAFPIDTFGDSFIDPVAAMYTKLIVLLGGLWQMAFPPKFVQMGNKSDGMDSMIRRLAKYYAGFKIFK